MSSAPSSLCPDADGSGIEFPSTFDTARLTLRAPLASDAAAVNAGVLESLSELQPWLPWATPVPSVAETEGRLVEAEAKFTCRTELRLLVFLRGTNVLVGSSGLHGINWRVPRFEIGYWLRTSCVGHGYMVEAVIGQTEFARDFLHARRVDIRVDDRNERSWRVAERAGFQLEGILRHDTRRPDGTLRNTRIYSRVF